MRVEVMQHYGLTQPLSHAGYFETSQHKQLLKDIKGAILEGRLIAVCGVVGSGKTVTMRRLQQQLKEENKVTVSSVSRTKAKAFDAVPKMGDGLPKPACRSWLQTARCCCAQKAWW